MTEKEQEKIDTSEPGIQPDTTEIPEVKTDSEDARTSAEDVSVTAAEPESGSLPSEVHRIIHHISRPRRQHYSQTHVIIALSAVLLVSLVLLLVSMLRRDLSTPAKVLAYPSDSETFEVHRTTSEKSKTVDTSGPVREILTGRNISEKEKAVLDEAVSLETARTLFQNRQYRRAHYVFEKLQDRLLGKGLREQCLRDWLTLQMARCLHKTGDDVLMDEVITELLNSHSLVIRAMANYHVAIYYAEKQRYYESYQRIYRALALLKAFEKFLPPSTESSCYFLAAESLTHHTLKMNNVTDELPASSWAEIEDLFEFSIESQDQLADLLMTGIHEMNNVALMPKVEFYPKRNVGMQWTLKCLDAPVKQVLWQFASESDLSVNWKGKTQGFEERNITVYLPFVDRHYLAEVIASSAGLVWRYDGHTGTIYDPANYGDLSDMHDIFVQEAISMWRRFLIRYRNNPRTPHAQFCLGRLYTIADEKPMALGVYKQVANQNDQNALAAYALYNTAMIKIDMRDYNGAKKDLNELLIRYPDCIIVNKALLVLAEVLMESGFYAESAQTYDRVLYTELDNEGRREALFGLGRCAYETKDFETAAKWLAQALEITSGTDSRVGSICFMLGQTYISLKQYEKALNVLRIALGSTLDNDEYVETVLKLAKVECKQEKFLEALTVLESVSQERLNQDDSCRVLVAKADVYKRIGLLDAAMSLLRRQIEFVAEASLRAQLSLELAHCYILNEDLRIAEQELNEAMYDLPVGYDSQRAGYLLAWIAFRKAEYEKAQLMCLRILETQVEDQELYSQICYLLGEIYTKKEDYPNAALAFAGRLSQEIIP